MLKNLEALGELEVKVLSELESDPDCLLDWEKKYLPVVPQIIRDVKTFVAETRDVPSTDL